MRGDVRTLAEVHKANCHSPRGSETYCYTPGSVRRCPHWIIQEAMVVPGYAHCHWFDISRLRFFRYRRAKKVLARDN